MLLEHINHMNLYCVANNHVMQHGNEAYIEMLENIKLLGSDYIGSCDQKHYIFSHQNKEIGIIAFNQRPENFSSKPKYWSMPEYTNIENELLNIKYCDFKIAYIHWGIEFINRPYNDQQQFAHWLIDNGIDLIVGMHQYVLQGYEIYKDKYIFYSIGNFVFNMPWKPTKFGAIVHIDIQRDFKVSYSYIHIEEDFFPKITDEINVPVNFRFEYLNKLINLNIENEAYYLDAIRFRKQYRNSNYYYILKNLFRYNIVDLFVIFKDFIYRRLYLKQYLF